MQLSVYERVRKEKKEREFYSVTRCVFCISSMVTISLCAQYQFSPVARHSQWVKLHNRFYWLMTNMITADYLLLSNHQVHSLNNKSWHSQCNVPIWLSRLVENMPRHTIEHTPSLDWKRLSFRIHSPRKKTKHTLYKWMSSQFVICETAIICWSVVISQHTLGFFRAQALKARGTVTSSYVYLFWAAS